MDDPSESFSTYGSGTPDDTFPSREIAAAWVGEATAVEEGIAQRWLSAHVDVAETLRQAWDLSAQRQTPADLTRAWSTFQRRQAARSAEGIPLGPRSKTAALSWNTSPARRFSHRLRVWGVSAATIAALLAIILIGRARVIHSVTPAAAEVYTTANGQRATIKLADGTTVALNVGSTLNVPTDYAVGNHTVGLVGEAFFTVNHHVGESFTVRAGPTLTRVLGTSFVVRRYATDTTTTIAVKDGKVAVGSMVLAAQQFVEAGPQDAGKIRSADPSFFAFTTGVLALRHVQLGSAIRALDRWYDADIRLADPRLAARPYEGNVTAGSLADLAELLSVTFNVRAVRDGRVLILYPR